MPRYSLNRSPCCSTTSPGLSSVPASNEPAMTESAPAAIAFAMSPDEVMPPSAMTGRADARLDCVGAGGDQRLGCFGGCHVPRDHLDVPLRLDALDHFRHRCGMTV